MFTGLQCVLMYLRESLGVSSSEFATLMLKLCYKVIMYITRVPNRGSPPAVLLRESFRDNGKVKTRARWPTCRAGPSTRWTD